MEALTADVLLCEFMCFSRSVVSLCDASYSRLGLFGVVLLTYVSLREIYLLLVVSSGVIRTAELANVLLALCLPLRSVDSATTFTMANLCHQITAGMIYSNSVFHRLSGVQPLQLTASTVWTAVLGESC